MKVELFRGGIVTGSSIGVVDDVTLLARGDDELTMSGNGARALIEHLDREQAGDTGSVEFSLVADGVAYERCRILGTGPTVRFGFGSRRTL